MPWKCSNCGKTILQNLNSRNTIWRDGRRFHHKKGKICGEWIKIEKLGDEKCGRGKKSNA